MKKILFLVCMLFMSTNVFAKCVSPMMLDPSSGKYIPVPCPTTSCPSGTFMGDDGKCYDCDEKEDIKVRCIGKEKAFEICPYRNFHVGCGVVSKFCPKNNCLKGTFMGDDGTCHDCTKDEEISINCIGKELMFTTCSNRATRYIGNVLHSYICPQNYQNVDGQCCNGDDCIYDTIIDY